MKNYLRIFLLFFFISSVAYAQQIKVNGVVISAEDNEPVIGASITVKGNTSIGTVTDIDGKFQLSVPSGAKTLVVSYIGMKTQEIAAKAGSVKVILKSDAQELDEVVVTGYQKIDRRLFTGAAEKIKGKDAKIDGVTDVSQMLQGKVAGVSVQSVSGTFGAAPKMRVRGASSIYGDQRPLWVVDGGVLGDLVNVSADDLSSGDAKTLISSAVAGLNSDDIEDFQILKDASATALYGARAMNGVVVITTRKGRTGSASINYVGEFSTRFKPSYGEYNIMNSQEQMDVYRQMENSGWLNNAAMARISNGGVYYKMYDLINQYNETNGGFGLPNTAHDRALYLRDAEMRNTNWFDELFRNSWTQNHSVSLSGGTDRSRYYASLSYFNDPGWSVADKVERYTANFNSSFDLTKNFSLSFLTNASYRNQKAPGTLDRTVDVVNGEVNRDFDINPFSYALNSSRALDPNEYYRMNYAPFNIKNELENNYMDINVMDMKAQLELNWKPIKKLDFNAIGSFRYAKSVNRHKIMNNSNMANAYRADDDAIIRDGNKFLFRDPDDPNGWAEVVLPKGGFLNSSSNSVLNYYFRGTANYNDSFNDKHIVNILGGAEVRHTNREEDSYNGYGYDYDSGEPYVDYRIIRQILEGGFNYYSYGESWDRFVAFFGTASYSYQGKYTVNATGRYDGSNKMGQSKSSRWLPTWNVSGSWNASEEEFMRDIDWISRLSFRGTYGLVASMGPVTNALTVYKSGTTYRPYQNEKEPYIYISELQNKDLTWEKQYEGNVGFDFGVLNNRISLSLDAYWRKSFDLIGVIYTGGTGGQKAKYANYADMKSRGVEFTLNFKPIVLKDFKWNTDITFSYNHNEITKLDSKPRVIDLVSESGYALLGKHVRGLYSLQFKGLDENGIPTYINEDGELTNGDINFQESDKLGHLKYEGSVDPPYSGGMNNSFQYKNWKLNVFITYQFGNVIRLNSAFKSSYSDLDAMPREFKNRWRTAGDEDLTSIPTILSAYQQSADSNLKIAYNAYNFSTERVAKGDFIRMKEISLSYDFPQDWISKAKFKSLQLKAQVTNPFLIYADKKLNGQDPEFLRSGGVAMPNARQFTLTLRFGL